MKIDNTSKFRVIGMFTRLALLIVILFPLYLLLRSKISLYQRDLYLGLLLTGVSLLVYQYLSPLSYFLFEKDKDTYIFKYYTTSIFDIILFKSSVRKRIIIPKSEFVNARIEKRNGGLCKDLFLIQKTSRGLANYPPINVSYLSESQRKDLIGLLK